MGCIQHDCIVHGIKKGIRKEEVSELEHQDEHRSQIDHDGPNDEESYSKAIYLFIC